MVLAELGSKIQKALAKLNTSSTIDEEVLSLVLKEIARALMESDVNVHLVKKLQEGIRKSVNLDDEAVAINKRKLIQRKVYEELVKMLKPERLPYKPKKGSPNVYMFVGLQGSGKTTTIAKFANHWKRKGWKVAMVCADTFRAGAFDQLKQNATRIKVPFYGSYTEADPVKIAEEGVEQFRQEKYDIIIVDTSGRHKQETALFEEMEQVRNAVEPNEIVFVLDSTIGQSASDQAGAFANAVDVGSVIITKLDGHAKGGGALSAVAATGSPVIFIGTGEHFDAFDPFEAEGFVSRLLGMGDLKGLLNELKDQDIMDKTPKMMENLRKGQFTIRDMRDQFETMQKLGPIDRIMSMIPGLPPGLLAAGQEKEGMLRIKRFMYMMDSMNSDELDGKVPFTESRMTRIARGSGTFIQEVAMLLKYHKDMEGMISKMGKNKLLTDGNMQKQMMRNPQQMMQQLSRSMDPKLLNSMGGAQNMMNLVKQMGGGLGGGAGGAGGMPDMEGMMEMMKSMGGMEGLGKMMQGGGGGMPKKGGRRK